MKQVNAQVFSRTLAGVLVQFRNAVDDNNQNGANLCYVTALGLITGAPLSGGLDQAKGKAFSEDANYAFTHSPTKPYQHIQGPQKPKSSVTEDNR